MFLRRICGLNIEEKVKVVIFYSSSSPSYFSLLALQPYMSELFNNLKEGTLAKLILKYVSKANMWTQYRRKKFKSCNILFFFLPFFFFFAGSAALRRVYESSVKDKCVGCIILLFFFLFFFFAGFRALYERAIYYFEGRNTG